MNQDNYNDIQKATRDWLEIVVDTGSADTVRASLRGDSSLRELLKAEGQSVLRYAVERDKPQLVQVLLDNGVTPPDNWQLLVLPNSELARCLQDAQYRDLDAKEAWQRAKSAGMHPVPRVERLTLHQVKLVAFHADIADNNFDEVREWLRQADVRQFLNAPSQYGGRTCLDVAIENGHFEVAQMLVDAGAHAHQQTLHEGESVSDTLQRSSPSPCPGSPHPAHYQDFLDCPGTAASASRPGAEPGM